MVQQGASDLHLKVGRPPTLRVNGELQAMPLPCLLYTSDAADD